MHPRTYNPVALLKINKLGVLGGNPVRVSGVANARSALLSWSGFNVGKGVGATVSRTEGGNIKDIQEGRVARTKESMVPRAR